ncbi:RND family efflux transporter MFP subunit [Sulfuricella denitrificans skB26]|uniref:RND family efflux transporter MFP subunit n=1 Tax=Sulfuricella denitrificans (strain DSM 22764 / NBRC 105220 / skB26) TaxID=1163617 RepID=S6AAA3_SULDS|nr:efflux RND transporter periplasmic adaptor subunit [Sulfuricella denitrificans]BAN35510.1 RND family efflux transporter MFP subunit [Sulfuricella denitrificans skB26]
MNNASIDEKDPLARIVAAEKSARFLGLSGRVWVIVVLVLFMAIGVFYLRARSAASTPQYLAEEVVRGNLTVTVSATGNLQPTNQVDVGSELSGTIESVLVDDNDRVHKGQLLARLDLSKLNDQVAKSEAALVSAEAQVDLMRATVEESRANLARLRQVAELSGGKVPSRAELDTAQATLNRATANEAGSHAAVTQARATLKSDQTNLAKASIRSPIDGVVLARKVEPGQTVAASLQAPVLFTLAENLAQMELQVDVDEADVGQVHAGQSATFNVDAYAGRKYPANIIRVGYGSQTKDGVVSYKTILKVDNDDLSLRPGMTATSEITTATRENVLLVPNAALRFTPPKQSGKEDKKSGSFVSNLLPKPPSSTSSKPVGSPTKDSSQLVWVLRDGQPVAVPVTVGVSNGHQTEVTGGELKPGMQVITESVVTQK